ncbi:RES family NAD+ phosphorylase [Paraburkholderia elongata]|uniref:RES domain-containing protein n=1 Tax=Paraburkholderia elongata TaxID=2675747 RepID=A0A972P1E5_9BURK|nr:RES family NAD+ phosphorylase [Paraburkholderia elongata]NPT62333.1 RES domain-containing protein [Paraburkholderia elongata]
MSGPVTIWRIATDTPDYLADDTSGAGAKLTGGRWNRPGTPMLYCAGSIALACLETVVHLKLDGLPLNRYLVAIDVPEAVWAAATVIDPSSHVGWDALPHGKISLDAGEQWAASNASLLCRVPSVIVPQEYNVLINPLHADAAQLTFRKLEKWTYDSRLAPREGAKIIRRMSDR